MSIVLGTVLVVPLAPARTGNGLAMRAGMLLEVLAGIGPVDVVVVPVSGGTDGDEWLATTARRVVAVAQAAPTARSEVVAQLADPRRRAELVALDELPSRARIAAAVPIDGVCAGLAGAAPTSVVVLRSYLAPFGVRLARALEARRVVVDADDDDEGLLCARGDHDGARAHGILARTWLSQADGVLAASPVDAAAMANRYGFTVETLPNAVRRPPHVSEPPRHDRVLYIGNLTYEPNIEAVHELVLDVLPALQASVPGATVDVVGPHDMRLADLAGIEGVVIAGSVADVGPWYDGADVVVVPLRHGAGTRIKVLEAFARRRPVVATPAAVAGLEVADGRSVHLGTTAPELAAQAARLLRDRTAALRTADAAEAVLAEHYLLDVVAPRARRLLAGDQADQEEQ